MIWSNPIILWRRKHTLGFTHYRFKLRQFTQSSLPSTALIVWWGKRQEGGGLWHWPQEAVSMDKGWSPSAWDPVGLPSGEESSLRHRGVALSHWNGDAGRRHSSSQCPGTGVVGGLHRQRHWTRYRTWKLSGWVRNGDFHVPETLAHAPGCTFTVVQEKVSQVSENLRGELSQARRRRGWQCQVMKYSFGFLFLFFSNLLWNEHSKLCHHNLWKAAWFLHGNGWSCFY